MLLFFWAHWCVDCKGEAPILARLRSEYEMKGLKFMAPTKRYGYAARGDDAKPAEENAVHRQSVAAVLLVVGGVWCR